MKTVRYSFNRDIAPTTPDTADVLYGDLNNVDLATARLLPPCAPTKIVCVGRNYPEHARELGNEAPAEPIIFMKPPSSLIASGDFIVYPRLSRSVHYEGELGVIIGRRARRVAREQAMEHVAGYTIVNDVTARDLQKRDGQWTRGKGFDTFCAVGPCMAPRDELDLARLRVVTRLNGVVKQDGAVPEMLFPVDAIISFVSAFMTLEPGDLIATGTPPGVGPMEPGEQVEVEIEGIGVLVNSVVREA
jgi:2-keto-4-pentenoate hydratase/2-oxohepta-3-ene-1,7-dioic acid hydratase in catechol pathway